MSEIEQQDGTQVGAGEVEARITRAVGSVLFNVSNYPEPVQARMLGQDTAPLRDKIAAAVLAALSSLGYTHPRTAVVSISPSVDVTKVGLSPEGVALARALQDYGATVVTHPRTVSTADLASAWVQGACAVYGDDLPDFFINSNPYTGPTP